MSINNEKSIAIIDCSINTPSIVCFNRMQMASPVRLTYHHASKFGLESLKLEPANAYVILGSFSNVEDRLPWQRDLAGFAEEKLNQDIPVMGVCFGHQLLADRFGCLIEPNTPDRKLSHEGTRDIAIKTNRFGISTGPKELLVAHKFQITKLSDQIEMIATSEDCPFDGIQHKSLPFIGFQSHPEGSTTFARESILAALDQKQLASGMENGLAVMLDFFNFVKNL
jgi:GMP synthase (glutamine-hydrolysing)